MGYVGQNIKSLIKISTTTTLEKIKSMHYLDLMMANDDESKVIQENILWLTNFFASNSIPVDEFFADFIIIHSMSAIKVNTFILQGPTNTEKSLLLQLLLEDSKPTRISRERDKSNFHLD
jgi:hypothetical protein